MLTRLQHSLRRLARDRSGFSLVEILMVLLVIAVGILPIAVVQHQASREVTESEQYSQAVALAQTQLERIKGLGFGVAVADSGSDGFIAWNARVTNVRFGLDRIDLTATWTNQDGPQTLVLTDLVSMR